MMHNENTHVLVLGNSVSSTGGYFIKGKQLSRIHLKIVIYEVIILFCLEQFMPILLLHTRAANHLLSHSKFNALLLLWTHLRGTTFENLRRRAKSKMKWMQMGKHGTGYLPIASRGGWVTTFDDDRDEDKYKKRGHC